MAPNEGKNLLDPKILEESITFTVNGTLHTVPSSVPPTTTLVDYLRENLKLTGTKCMCYEGGCGICTVVATTADHETKAEKTFAIRGCQTLLYSCAGWKIETIESLGNKTKGYHPLQQAVTGFYASQCGYCTPGFIMNMHGEQKRLSSLSMKEVEMLFDGNLCRCTGYRPILDAFKSQKADAPADLRRKLIDIEEVYKARCPNTGELCRGTCSTNQILSCKSLEPQKELQFSVGEIQWLRPTTLDGVYDALKNVPAEENIRIVVGNTGQGVFKYDGPYQKYIDTKAVPELSAVDTGKTLKIGSNVSLTRCIQVFHQVAKDNPSYQHMEIIAKHWEFVANNGIRNAGCWAGNLMMKHKHVEFPSDIFLTLTVVDAILQIAQSSDGSITDVPISKFLEQKMDRNLIISMMIPPQENVFIRTYKITQRAVNSHAYVNAAFKFELNKDDQFRVTKKPYILFGGIRPDFVHASNTENFLAGKRLGLTAVLKEAATQLGNELKPDSQPLDASPAYRTSLAQGLLYKAVLDLMGAESDPEYQSGGPILIRSESKGKQSFDPNQDTWPVGQAMPKLESDYQTSGEAQYVNDIPGHPGELHGAYVQTTVGKANIDVIDPSEALKVEGVVDFVTAKDIPGRNSFLSKNLFLDSPKNDPIFVDDYIAYAGQAAGLILATRRDIALRAAKMVKITYKNQQKPILTIRDALKTEGAKILDAPEGLVINNLEDEAEESQETLTVEGEYDQDTQYHMPMEPFNVIIIPIEDGFDVYAPTQFQMELQAAIAECLDISTNSVNIFTKRIGGSYGCKISRGQMTVCGAAVASNKHQVPVRVYLPLEACLSLTAAREPYFFRYKVSFDNKGMFSKMNLDIMSNQGHVENESSTPVTVYKATGPYYADTWNITPKTILTDRGGMCAARAPGSVNAASNIENIIEHVADYLNKDPLEVREINYSSETRRNKSGRGPQTENLAATSIVPLLKEQTMYKARRAQIDQFNKENRWKKRGITLMATHYPLHYPPFRYSSHVVIYEHDGSIAISHGGIEMGQGINTKAAQVAAKILDRPVDSIKIKPTNTFTGANSIVTGGSFGSDLVAYATQVCCERLKKRMDVIAEALKKANNDIDPPWIAVVKACYNQDVDLSERYITEGNNLPKSYDIFAGMCLEVELDVLTGQFLILRADAVEDCGRSLSPYIDVGQIEGAIMMGFGYFTTELIKLDENTGKVLTTGTWDYKVPSALDIPVEFNVSLMPRGDNKFGVQGSKATGEPAVCLGYALVCALRHAIKSARADAGTTGWFQIDTPLTVERIQQLCLVSPSQFNLKKNETEVEEPFETLEIVDETPQNESQCIIH